MKALTITQPWASAIAYGRKACETRSWGTNYRGLLAIHAGKRFQAMARDFAMVNRYLNGFGFPRVHELPLGQIIAVALLDNVWRIPDDRTFTWGGTDEEFKRETTLGDWRPGRYVWHLDRVERIKPVAINGMQGLWECPIIEVPAALREFENFAV